MSILENAQHVSIYGGNFISAQAYHQHLEYVKTASDILKDHVVSGALHDSSERFDPPRCHPETRTAVLNRIDLWARSPQTTLPVLWLNGAAGAGKSAIAQTLCERWKDKDILVASFFFSRTGIKRNENTFVIPTFAYQVSSHIPEARIAIEEVILHDPGIFEKNIRTQIEALMVRPLKAVSELNKPLVIVIDGLDECSAGAFHHEYAHQQKEIMDAITFGCQHLPALRFLVASRPEQQIRDCFTRKPLSELTTEIVLNDTLNPTADIRLFLLCRFDEIKQSNAFIDPEWPPHSAIATLIMRSSGQFIFPSLVMRYISNPREDPVTSLAKILRLETPRDFRSGEKPFAEIDAVYSLIISSTSPKSRAIVMDILGVLCSLPRAGALSVTTVPYKLFPRIFEDTENLSPLFFERFLFLPPGEVYRHLIDLHSILEIPAPQDHQRDQPIQLLHATLPEFLTAKSRAKELFVGKEHYVIRRQILLCKHMQSEDLKIPYDESTLLEIVWRGLLDCTPNKEIRDAIWDTLKDKLGPYPPPLNLVGSRKSICGRSDRLDKLWSLYKADIIKYLRECNVAEIEPSPMIRFRVSRHLKEALSHREKKV